MIIEAKPVGPIQGNCFVLGCPETREALVIDPGDEPGTIEAMLSRNELTPKIYLLTHGHIDHVGAATPLRDELGGKILLHEADLFLYDNVREHALSFGLTLPDTKPPDRFIVDGESITWGALRGTVLHTPGHSPGGICFIVPGELVGNVGAKSADGKASQNPGAEETGQSGKSPDWVFCGDTLFNGSIGRTDLPGGSHATLMNSIKEKLLCLPDETIIAPGHGALSTIGAEKKINPFVREVL
jgi:glyoxylase-like metal-dependent hydrolase (beta-lactamase superfamily II)